ncbi:MAG: hypothetical protein OXU70_18345, partial [Gammaproteobacteria bacterium]|nr:hypothetical protein [Gammaproteobacteria bacterium]
APPALFGPLGHAGMVTGGPTKICTLFPYVLCEIAPAWLGCREFRSDRPNFGGLRTAKGLTLEFETS